MEEFVKIFKALSEQDQAEDRSDCSSGQMPSFCVCEIMDSLGESQYNISRHLRSLKLRGWLKKTRLADWVFYSPMNPVNSFQELVIQSVSAMYGELFAADDERLRKR